MIHINQERVKELGQSLKQLPAAPDLAQQLAPKIKADPETQLRAFLYAASICHSTKGGLKGDFDGRPYKGWDYLYNAFRKLAENEPTSLEPEKIKELTSEQLLAYLTRHATNPQVALADLDRRAEILRQLAYEIIQHLSGELMTIVKQSQNQVGGEKGAYAQLARLSAFQDSLQKKSSVFLMLAEGSGIMTIKDQSNLVPMIDYHLIRELLRMGCIEIDDSVLRTKLLKKEMVDASTEEQMREQVKTVCLSLVEQTGLPMMQVDNMLWGHARSYCRHAPVCVSGNQPENTSFNEFTATTFNGTCPFQTWCPGAKDSEYRDLWEPITETENY